MPASNSEKRTPTLFVFFGMIATGKSTLAMAWARHKKLAYFNSDSVRKELAGLSPTESRQDRVDTGIYTQDFTQKTYQALKERAEAILRQGNSVILDASYQYTRDRQSLRTLAKNLNCRVCFILCQCTESEMKRRMTERAQDRTAVSDGRWEIYLEQKQRFEPPEELADTDLITIDTQAPLAELLEVLDNKTSIFN